jgi:hypothetical protein
MAVNASNGPRIAWNRGKARCAVRSRNPLRSALILQVGSSRSCSSRRILTRYEIVLVLGSSGLFARVRVLRTEHGDKSDSSTETARADYWKTSPTVHLWIGAHLGAGRSADHGAQLKPRPGEAGRRKSGGLGNRVRLRPVGPRSHIYLERRRNRRQPAQGRLSRTGGSLAGPPGAAESFRCGDSKNRHSASAGNGHGPQRGLFEEAGA